MISCVIGRPPSAPPPAAETPAPLWSPLAGVEGDFDFFFFQTLERVKPVLTGSPNMGRVIVYKSTLESQCILIAIVTMTTFYHNGNHLHLWMTP